ncbi:MULTISPECIES: hypothetical protein [Clostridium]|uniref:hypothetical protein n=1 Tax=Clostridium TaxID=1485 RepID=UPI001EEF1D51|nr:MULTISPECIES: hypothetical protein [Clostridium]WRY51035.1 hypothetical protein P8F83_20700 [Clostridium intestinale]
MIKKHYINNLCNNEFSYHDDIIIWEIDFNNRNRTCVLQSSSSYNPCDYIQDLFRSVKEINPEICNMFIDLKNFYGDYTDSWFWKCTFILDSCRNLDDVVFEDIQDINLTKDENQIIKEYLYRCVQKEAFI